MSVTLAVLKNPFNIRDRDILRVDLDGHQPFSAFLKEHVRIGDEMEYHASINGRVYSPEEIPAQIVVPGDYVAVCPVLRGGGGNAGRSKNPLAILAGIALAIFSFGVVAPAVGSIFGGSALAAKLAGGLTLMVGGQLISNAFSPKVKEAEDTTSHQWSALQPINQQGAMIPITYGTVRTAGQIINQYIRVEGDAQYMDMLLCGGEGYINEFSDIRINDNPADNYEDVTYATRPGANTQPPISGFENVYDTQYVGVTLNVGSDASGKLQKDVAGEWMTFELEGDTVDKLEVTMDFPEGLCNYGNDIEDTWVFPEFEYSLQGEGGSWGGWVPWFSEAIEAATTKPITRARRTEKLISGRYRVRGRMLKVQSTDAGHVRNKLIWTSLTAIVESPMMHPNKALLGISIKATDQLNGGSPTVTWRQTRRSVYVYMNGQWVQKDAQNPAWIIYDLCVQARALDGVVHVFGEQPERMDLTAFAAWATWNEQTLGNRGPIKMNLLVDESKSLWDWVNDIASSARGAVVMRGTKISCIWDQPAEPVQLFTMGNIVEGSFSGEFLSVDGRANAVEISFLNEAKNFEREQITVYAHDFDDIDTRANPVSIELTGITNFEQAWQEGLYRLNQNRYILRTITFTADVDAIACQVGDVILVQHDIPRWGQGGRILAIDGNRLTLDHQIDLSAGVTYNIIIRKQDDSLLQRTATGSGTTDTITISSAAGLNPYDVFAIGEMQAVAKPFRVQEMSRDGDLHVTLTCTEYIKELYTEDGVPPIIDYSIATNRIAGLTLTAGGYYSSTGQWIAELWAHWSYRGEKPASYEVEWKYDQGLWGQLNNTTETSAQCPLRDSTALYSVRVRALYASAPPSDWAYATSEGIVLGNGIPPDPPTNLTAKGWFGFAALAWVNPTNADLSHIEVWENNKDELATAKMVGQTRADNFTRVLPAGGTMWYWVRAVNFTGQKSEYNDQAGTPCIIDPESAEAWITDYLEKNPWLQEALDELNTAIEDIEIEIADIPDIKDIEDIKLDISDIEVDLSFIKDIEVPNLEGRIKDNEDRIKQNIEPALDRVAEGVLRLGDESDRTRNVFRWAGIDVNEDEGTVVIRAVEDLKTDTGYQFSEVQQRLDAQEANINLKASRVYVDELAASLISSVVVAEEWKFEGDLNGWTGQNATLTAQTAGIRYSITNANPSMTSPVISIDGATNNVISIQFRQISGEKNASIRIQYKTNNHEYSDDYMKRVDVLGSINTSRSVQVNMHSLDVGDDDWKNSLITGIRLLIGSEIGAEYEITLVNIGQSSVNELMLAELEMRITQAELDIDGANAAIALKADETVVKGLQQQLNSAELKIDGALSAITLKADKTEINGVERRLRNAEIAIDALDGGIIQQVLDYHGLQEQIDELASAALQNAINEDEGQERRRLQLALARQELTAKIEEAERAIANYRIQLLAVIDENKAYYDQQITAVADSVSAEVSKRELMQAQVDKNAAAILNEARVRAEADNAEASARTVLASTVSNNTAAIQSEAKTRATADTSLTSQINTLKSTVNSNTAAIQSEAKARADGDSAEAAARATLLTKVNNNTSAIQTEQTARINADNGLTTQINTLKTTVGSNTAAIQAEQKARIDGDKAEAAARATLQTKVNNNTAAIQTEAKTRTDADSGLSTQINTLKTTVGSNTAAIQTEQTARINADSGLTTQINTLKTTVGSNTAAIQAEQKARIDGDKAEAAARATLQTKVNNNTAAIQTEAKARADGDSSLTQQINQVKSTASNNSAAIKTEQQTRASADSALSSNVSTLQSTVNGQSTKIQTNATAISTLNGQMKASYTIKLDNNGYVSGIQLLNGGSGQSGIVLSTDAFMIAKPGYTSKKQMLVYDSASGQLVLNSLMVNRAAILDASVDTLKIAGRSVTMPVGVNGTSYVTWGYNHRDVIGTFYPILTPLNYEAVVLGCPVIKNQEVWLTFTCGITAEMSTIWLRLIASIYNSAGQQITGSGFTQDIPDVWSAFANERRSGSFSISTMFTPRYDGTLWVWPYWCVKYTHGSTSGTINFNRSSINDYSLLALQCMR